MRAPERETHRELRAREPESRSCRDREPASQHSKRLLSLPFVARVWHAGLDFTVLRLVKLWSVDTHTHCTHRQEARRHVDTSRRTYSRQ